MEIGSIIDGEIMLAGQGQQHGKLVERGKARQFIIEQPQQAQKSGRIARRAALSPLALADAIGHFCKPVRRSDRAGMELPTGNQR